jgi:hypothetical protein
MNLMHETRSFCEIENQSEKFAKGAASARASVINHES